MNEYDDFEAEMLSSGKSLEEIERLWNMPPGADCDQAVIDAGERDAKSACET
jgi:hypothetical protein